MAIVTPELAEIWRRIQVCLLPGLEECLDEPLTERLKQFVRVLEVVRIEKHIAAPPELAQGRPCQDRRFLARAFLAKAVYNLPTTELLMEMLRLQPNLRRLCGWERRRQIPSPATFSRAFGEFAAAGLGDAVHAARAGRQARGPACGHARQPRRHGDRRPPEEPEEHAQAEGTTRLAQKAGPTQEGRSASAGADTAPKATFADRRRPWSKRCRICRACARRAPKPTPKGIGTSGWAGKRTSTGLMAGCP